MECTDDARMSSFWRRGTPISSYSAARAKKAPPPAPSKTGGGSAVGHVASAITDGLLWGAGSAMAHRAIDAVHGPRKFEIEHTTTQQQAAAAAPGGPCDIHAQAFLDCINQNGSDISRCQFYVDILNDCRRRRGQAAAVEASG
ncbi:coiled-coil-helix-coiled-coil-helix domain-containing protein 2-like [Panicum virgatum]|uniref:coiled-coil-helix-coiled-coil-helix domain-containing protein 2-like n=1 Tax=Panicum virgatum TaxID=38727 RepID=UPI0019D5881F|nr:coiled-coil-helix-coiled-coil-helix domain-containing protein 2-like [Panicum virgatum]